jgi:polyisoprenoid-binding protein YceI
MKKLSLCLLAFTLIFAVACKSDTKEKETNTNDTKTKILSKKNYSVVGKTSTLKWTAYKTTDKVAVSGKFNSINITESKTAESVEEAINGVHFSIPVSSIFSGDASRDSKLQEFFFGAMTNTDLITGSFEVQKDKSLVNITMNGVTKSIPLDLKIEGQKVTFTNTIQLKDWNLDSALESLNKACFELHKGADGVSKTWDEAQIEGVIYLKVN